MLMPMKNAPFGRSKSRASWLHTICSTLVRPWPPYSLGQVIPAKPASYSLAWKAFCSAMTGLALASSSSAAGDAARWPQATLAPGSESRHSSEHLFVIAVVGSPGEAVALSGRAEKLKSVMLSVAPSEAWRQIPCQPGVRIRPFSSEGNGPTGRCCWPGSGERTNRAMQITGTRQQAAGSAPSSRPSRRSLAASGRCRFRSSAIRSGTYSPI